MTQRIFDVENEKDMADLWDILPDNAVCINFINKDIIHIGFKDDETLTTLFKINWHDKTEITRPIQEATEQDLGKLCKLMTDLTSQWKKGELPEGFYFVNDGSEVTIDYYLCDYWERHLDSHIYKVLASVPSYEEWVAAYECQLMESELVTTLKEQINHLLKTQARQFVDNQKLQVKAEKAKDVVNIDTARQIKQLKELLKECQEIFDECFSPSAKHGELYKKIDEVLK